MKAAFFYSEVYRKTFLTDLSSAIGQELEPDTTTIDLLKQIGGVPCTRKGILKFQTLYFTWLMTLLYC